jgi:hypothetical protein
MLKKSSPLKLLGQMEPNLAQYLTWPFGSGELKSGICCFSAKQAALRKKSRLVGSESGQCVGVGQHVCLQTVCISLSFLPLIRFRALEPQQTLS